MKRIILGLFLALITFFIGIAGVFLWWKISPPTVTLCQLAQNPSFYNGQTVRIEADAESVFGMIFIFDETCASPDAASGVWKAEGYKPVGGVQRLFTESDTEKYKARIFVTGQFDAEATRGCYVPKFAIRATDIEVKSEIKTELLKKTEE